MTRVVHACAHPVHREQVVGRGAERHVVTGEPLLASLVRENYRHAVMQCLHGRVRFGREDGEGFDDIALRDALRADPRSTAPSGTRQRSHSPANVTTPPARGAMSQG